MITIAIMNQKGGVGKTTTAVNLAVGLNKFHDKKVLLIDADPQGNASIHLGIRARGEGDSIAAVFSEGKAISSIVQQSEGVDVAPSYASLGYIDRKNYDTEEDIGFMAYALMEADYDVAVIDCPPSLSSLSRSALAAANTVIIPITGEYLSIEGLARMIETVGDIRRKYNSILSIMGILITHAQKTTMYQTTTARVWKLSNKVNIFKTSIRMNTVLAEASAVGKSIYEYKKRCNGYQDYINFTYEVKQKLSEKK